MWRRNAYTLLAWLGWIILATIIGRVYLDVLIWLRNLN